MARLLAGAAAPLDVAATYFAFTGRRLVEAMEAYDRVASFMVILGDTSRGRVRRSRAGTPQIRYWLGHDDVARLHQGIVRIAEIFRAAGARRIFPTISRLPIVEGDAGLARLLRARDPFLLSFHPMGRPAWGATPGPASSIWSIASTASPACTWSTAARCPDRRR